MITLLGALARCGTLVLLAPLTLLLVGSGAAQAEPSLFAIVPDKSYVRFVSATQLGEFKGKTKPLKGEILFDVKELSRTRVSVTVEPGDLNSDNALRDRHMREDLLEIVRFPLATFTSSESELEPGSNAAALRGTLHGTLEMHGVTRKVSVPVQAELDGGTLQAEGTFTVNLTDFGMSPPRLLGLKVKNAVAIEVHMVAVRR